MIYPSTAAGGASLNPDEADPVPFAKFIRVPLTIFMSEIMFPLMSMSSADELPKVTSSLKKKHLLER